LSSVLCLVIVFAGIFLVILVHVFFDLVDILFLDGVVFLVIADVVLITALVAFGAFFNIRLDAFFPVFGYKFGQVMFVTIGAGIFLQVPGEMAVFAGAGVMFVKDEILFMLKGRRLPRGIGMARLARAG
jgi:hypothetical protein